MFDLQIDADLVGGWRPGDFAGAHLQHRREIVGGTEALIGTCAAHLVVPVLRIPVEALDTQTSVPRIAQFRFRRNFGEIARVGVLLARLRELLRQLLESRLVAGVVGREFGLRNGAAEFRFELIAADHFRGGEQGAGGAVALLHFGNRYRLHDIRHPDGVDFIARLQQLLFQVKEDLGEAGPLLGEGEDGFIDHLQSQRGLHSLALRVGDAEAYARFVAGLIDGGVGRGVDLEFVGGLYEDQAVVAHGARVAAEEVGAEIHRAGQVGRGGERQFRLAVGQVEIAGEHGLAVLHDVDVGRAALAGGEDFQQNAIAGAIYGALRAEQNLLFALAKFEGNGGGGAIALGVGSIHLQGPGVGSGAQADHGHAALVGGRGLVGVPRGVDLQVGGGRRPVGVRGQQEDLVLQVRHQRAAFGDRGEDQRILADRDGFSASLGVSGGILHGGLDQYAGGAVIQRHSGEIRGQLEVKAIGPVAVRLPLRRPRAGKRHIQSGPLDGDFGVVYRLAEEVVGADSAGDVVARAVAAPGVGVLAGELHRHLEFRQDIALHVESELRRVGRAAGAVVHQGAQVVSAEIDFVGEAKLGGCDAVRVGLSDLLEDLVAARVFHFEGQLAARGGLVTGAIERECAHVDGLPGLINGLLRGEQNRGLGFQAHLLGELGGADRRVHGVAHGIASGDAGGEAELRLRSAAAIQAAGEEHTGMVAGRHQVDAHSPGAGNGFILRIGDDDADGGRSAAQIGLLPEDVDYRGAEDFRNRFRALDRGVLLIGVSKAITDAVPDKVVEGGRFGELDFLAPGSVGGDGVHASLGTAQYGVLGIEDFDGQLSGAGIQAVEGNGDAQCAAGVGGARSAAGRGLGALEGLHGQCGGDKQQCSQEQNTLRRLVHEGSPLFGPRVWCLEIGPRKRPMSSRHWGNVAGRRFLSREENRPRQAMVCPAATM